MTACIWAGVGFLKDASGEMLAPMPVSATGSGSRRMLRERGRQSMAPGRARSVHCKAAVILNRSTRPTLRMAACTSSRAAMATRRSWISFCIGARFSLA